STIIFIFCAADILLYLAICRHKYNKMDRGHFIQKQIRYLTTQTMTLKGLFGWVVAVKKVAFINISVPNPQDAGDQTKGIISYTSTRPVHYRPQNTAHLRPHLCSCLSDIHIEVLLPNFTPDFRMHRLGQQP
ncbi:hypothetical protein ACJX0J_038893, partial [Zea mays]